LAVARGWASMPVVRPRNALHVARLEEAEVGAQLQPGSGGKLVEQLVGARLGLQLQAVDAGLAEVAWPA
jgi:uncharacterized protein (DUF697 family)